jgi:hypothetical protein
MSVEEKLTEALQTEDKHGEKFHQQIAKFRSFEEQLKQGGLEIEKRRFSIPLMERLGVSYLHQS